MTLPLVIVYLHDVKGIGLGDAGIALAAVGLGGVIATVVAGSMVDRVGAGWTAVCGLLLAGVGTAGYLAVDSTGSAIAASAAQGAGFAATWVGVFPILIRAVDPRLRGDVLGANYAATNLGLGIGSTIAGVVLLQDGDAFTPLFVADAATYGVFALLLWVGEIHGGIPVGSEAAARGYGAVVRDHALLVATGLNLLLVTAGFSQFTSAFPAWATGVADAPRSLVGFAFAANTWTIAVAQLPVLALVRGRRRTRAVAATGLLFASCWVIILVAGEVSQPMLSYAGFIAAAAVFGFGQTLSPPASPRS